MPELIKRINNIRFYVFSNEGPRPHVHVELGGHEVQVWLDTFKVKKSNTNRTVEKRFVKLVQANAEEILKEWNNFFKVEPDDE